MTLGRPRYFCCCQGQPYSTYCATGSLLSNVLSESTVLSVHRNCHNEITVVVWRTLPIMKPYFEGLIHRPSYKASAYDTVVSPAGKKRDKTPPLLTHPAHGRRSGRKQGLVSEGGHGSLWRDKREDKGEYYKGQEPDYGTTKIRTRTLKGTRVTSSNGDNYIILSPVDPGSQVMV
ncbi:unnamed protein product [Oncorhynchus mykiss]|uniref:Uncharacterized protein n=1 Tax=Oncorhynchus mykiss TaxID=8022 RepID=A0A060X8H7_ONCMY|nr:unnamed protein product [Oncorhynchus mykiss]